MSLRSSWMWIGLALGALGSGAACSDDDGGSDGGAGKSAAGEGGASAAGSGPAAGEAGAAGAVPTTPTGGGGAGDGGGAAGGGGSGADAGGTPGGSPNPGGAGGEGGAAPPPNVLLDPLDGALLGAVDAAAPRALYFYGADLPAGPTSPAVSTCVDACLAAWPAFHAAALSLPAGLNAEDFGELARVDGTQQTTFKGWPLYLYAAEVDAASRSGEGATQLWHAVEQPFYSLVIMKSSQPDLPLYLADGAGRTIYELQGDTAATADADPVSTCTTAGCRRAWPVVSLPSVKAVSSISGDLDLFIRPEAQEIQFSYAGFPIYYFNNDKLPGDLLGVGKPLWVLAEP